MRKGRHLYYTGELVRINIFIIQTKFFKLFLFTIDRIIHLFNWSSLIDDGKSLGEVFQVITYSHRNPLDHLNFTPLSSHHEAVSS
jgi:hypothetical protein